MFAVTVSLHTRFLTLGETVASSGRIRRKIPQGFKLN